MKNLSNLISMKFINNSSNSHQRSFITYENFPSRAPLMIITSDTESKLVESHFLNSNFKFHNSSIINLDKCKTNPNRKPKELITLAIKNNNYILFGSLTFIKLIKIIGIEVLRDHFKYLNLFKVSQVQSGSNKINTFAHMRCLYQKHVIDWLYKKMTDGQNILAGKILDLYIDLYTPRDLTSINRIKYISDQKQTLLSNGNLASILNSGGYINKSWILYRNAVTTEVQRKNVRLPHPHWGGESFKNKRIVFRRVHGPSDEILYANIFNDLIKDNCNVIIETDKRLVDLFTRSFPYAEVIPRLDHEPHPRLLKNDIDFQANYSDPFEIYRDNLKKFPNHNGYLIPDSAKVEHWKTYFNNLFGDNIRVGISWGSLGTGQSTNLFTTTLEQWENLLLTPGVNFINLEYNQTVKDNEWLKENSNIKIHKLEGIDLLNDLDSLAAVISNLDLIISINNINSNLAGAIDIPTFTLVPNFWYYLFGTKTDYFFPKSKIFTWKGNNNQSHSIHNANKNLNLLIKKLPRAESKRNAFRQTLGLEI